MIDDQNEWLGCLGHRQVKTPNIDRLANRGRSFTDAHCPSPLCNPARNSIMTGLRSGSIGIYSLIPGIRDVPCHSKRRHPTADFHPKLLFYLYVWKGLSRREHQAIGSTA